MKRTEEFRFNFVSDTPIAFTPMVTYKDLLWTFGIEVCNEVLKIIIDEERYEEAQMLKDAIISHCIAFKVPTPDPFKPLDIVAYKKYFARYDRDGEEDALYLNEYINLCYNGLKDF